MGVLRGANLVGMSLLPLDACPISWLSKKYKKFKLLNSKYLCINLYKFYYKLRMSFYVILYLSVSWTANFTKHFSYQLSVMSYKLSAISHQLSAISYQLAYKLAAIFTKQNRSNLRKKETFKSRKKGLSLSKFFLVWFHKNFAHNTRLMTDAETCGGIDSEDRPYRKN